MEQQKEMTVEQVVNMLPKSIVTTMEDGSVSINRVIDMVQAQMDREKEFKAIKEQAASMYKQLSEAAHVVEVLTNDMYLLANAAGITLSPEPEPDGVRHSLKGVEGNPHW